MDLSKKLLKFFDDQVDLEFFLIVREEDIEKIKALLDEYRKTDEEYNNVDFIQYLRDNDIWFEDIDVVEIYF